MAVTKVFRSGNSQAVRIPKQFHLESSEVVIEKRGDCLVLRPVPHGAAGIFDALAALEGIPPRVQPLLEKRPKLR